VASFRIPAELSWNFQSSGTELLRLVENPTTNGQIGRQEYVEGQRRLWIRRKNKGKKHVLSITKTPKFSLAPVQPPSNLMAPKPSNQRVVPRASPRDSTKTKAKAAPVKATKTGSASRKKSDAAPKVKAAGKPFAKLSENDAHEVLEVESQEDSDSEEVPAKVDPDSGDESLSEVPDADILERDRVIALSPLSAS
jgi:hypothetical protein